MPPRRGSRQTREHAEKAARARNRLNLLQRLERRYEVVDRGYVTPCWEWTGVRTQEGYGHIKIGGRRGVRRYVHVVAYRLFVGPIPEGRELDHLCRNKPCFNPDHLDPVTHAENCKRGLNGKPRPFGPAVA